MAHFISSALIVGGLLGLFMTAPDAFGADCRGGSSPNQHVYTHEYKYTNEAENERMALWLYEQVAPLTIPIDHDNPYEALSK